MDKYEYQLPDGMSIGMLHELRAALDKHAIIGVTDSAGRILYVNEKFCQISKYSREELIGKDHRILNSGHHPKGYFGQMWKTIAGGETWRGEVKNKAKDGSFYWVDATIVPVRGENGRIARYIAIRVDITQEVALREKLKESNERLQVLTASLENEIAKRRYMGALIEQQDQKLVEAAKLASIGEMTSVIMHEINNPLALISYLAQNLSEASEREIQELNRVLEISKKIEGTVARVGKVVKGMKTLSHRSDSQELEKTNLKSLIEESLLLCEARFKCDGVKVEAGDIPEVFIKCAPVQISQVFVNLFNNAADAISNRSEKWIKVSCIARANEISLRVIDSGSGIPVEVREKLFQTFFTTKEPGKGTGLGLSISKTIIEKHGGSLSIDADCPNTCFEIRLPVWESHS